MVIGITGNIGCGKTAVAKMFEELGAEVIEADKIGHLLLERKDVRDRLVQAFGSSILNKEGAVLRERLRRIVFKDKEKLRDLNLILHPLMIEEIRRIISTSSSSLIVLDAAVLFEAGWNRLVDKVLVVTSSYDVQLGRIRKSTNLTPEEIRGVMQAQLPQEEKARRADFVIENEGDLEGLRDEVKKLWKGMALWR